jgi:hypothetical protein
LASVSIKPQEKALFIVKKLTAIPATRKAYIFLIKRPMATRKATIKNSIEAVLKTVVIVPHVQAALVEEPTIKR